MGMEIRSAIRDHMRVYPFTTTRIARKQAVKLLNAKGYLEQRGIAVSNPKSTLVYTKATGMFK